MYKGMNQRGDHEKENNLAIPDSKKNELMWEAFSSDSVLFLSNQISSDHRRGSA